MSSDAQTTPAVSASPAVSAPTPAIDPTKTTNSRVVDAPFQIEVDHNRQRYLKILIYGKHGAGKTELAATAVDVPQMRDVLFVDAESGDTTTENTPRIKNPRLLKSVRVTNFKQVAYVLEFLRAYCFARDSNDVGKMRALYCRVTGLKPESVPDDKVPRFQTVLVDSLTEVDVYCTHAILGLDSNKVMMEGNMEVAGWPEFRKNNEMVKLLVRAFRDLPMNVIFVCAEQYTQDETKKFHYTPALTGKLSAQVQGFVDIVGWLTVGQPQDGQVEAPRRLYIQPIGGGPRFDAKNRRPVYNQPYFDNPSMTSIMQGVQLLK